MRCETHHRELLQKPTHLRNIIIERRGPTGRGCCLEKASRERKARTKEKESKATAKGRKEKEKETEKDNEKDKEKAQGKEHGKEKGAHFLATRTGATDVAAQDIKLHTVLRLQHQ